MSKKSSRMFDKMLFQEQSIGGIFVLDRRKQSKKKPERQVGGPKRKSFQLPVPNSTSINHLYPFKPFGIAFKTLFPKENINWFSDKIQIKNCSRL